MPVKIGSEFLVNAENTYGQQSQPDIAGTADGSFTVAWRSEFRPGEEDLDFEIQARSFIQGRPQGREFRVNEITQDGQSNPTIAARPDGSFIIAYSSGWEDSLPGTSTNTRFLDNAGTLVGPEYVSDYDYYHWNAEAASFADGATVTVWSEEYKGVGEIRGPDGTPSASFDFGWDWIATPRALAVISDTSFAVAWHGYLNEEDAYAGGDPKFYGQILDRSGGGGTAFEIGTAAGSRPDPSITRLSNGNFVVVWTDGVFVTDYMVEQGADVKARIFTPEGEAIGDAFTVHSGLIGDQFNPDVAAISDGRFVVVWEDGTGNPEVFSPVATIQGQVFTAEGARQGEQFQVHSPSSVSSGQPSITSLGEDRFAVAWQGDEGDEGVDGGIKVQLFAADGAPAPETIIGGNGSDRLLGAFGDDLIKGGKAADTIYGGFGDDRLLGEKGEDFLYGGGGTDVLFGGWQSDRLDGEIGNDTLYGDLAAIGARSRGANDQLFGGEGDDILYGDATTIAAGGYGGNDVLSGGRGNDRLYGDGASGAGVASGGGDDRLEGGWGNDELWGGGGNDRFVFNGLIGADVIWDFGQEPGDNDVIDLRGTDAGRDTGDGLQIYYVDGNAELYFNGGHITLIGITSLSSNDILL